MDARTVESTAPRGRALLIGRSPNVMERVLDELSELGVAAMGTTDPANAARDYDAAKFDLVVFGGGVEAGLANRLRSDFSAHNPVVRFLSVFASEAPRRIVAALDGRSETDVDLSAYFARIGYDGPRAPTLETLRAVQTQHLASIPFEAIDAILGRGVDLAPAAVDAKLIAARRGGYCYEQNGLFKRVLTALGFEAAGLLCRVRMGHVAGAPPAPRTHMALRVTIDETRYLADVGFGGIVPPEPLRLDEDGVQETAHEAWRITPFGPVKMAEARVGDAFAPMYEIHPDVQLDADYEPANWFTATHPSSFFRRDLVAARVTPEARYALFGARLTVRRPGAPPEQRMLDGAGIEAALQDTFGLTVEDDWRPLIRRAAAGE